MRHSPTQFLLLLATLGLISACSLLPKPPVAEKEHHTLVMHGDTRIDPYYWLNQRDSQKVLDYLIAENAYTEAMMEPTIPLQEKLFNEMKLRQKEEDITVPVFLNGYYYYIRYEEGKEYPINCRKKGILDAPEEIILDENEVAAGHSYCQVASLDISPNNKVLAYGVDTIGRRQFTIHFKNLETGKLICSKIDNTTGAIAWANDNHTVFYSQKDKSLRPYKIFRHSIKSPNSQSDALIYHETDSTFDVNVYTSKSRELIMIMASSSTSSEYRYLNANNPLGTFTLIQPRQPKLEYSVEHLGSNFYIKTNWNAENFRVMETPIAKPAMDNWKELIAHRNNVLIMDIDIFKDFLVVKERKDALIHVKVLRWADKKEFYIDFGEEVYTALPSVNPEFDTPLFVYYYTSLTTPGATYEYNMQTQEKRLVKQNEILGDFTPSNYETKRLWATANDGTKIPISIVHKKGIKLNGKSPLLIYAYGAYGYSENPTFDPNRLSLLNRGFIYAIAHVRGGEEMGRKWYEMGKMLNKQNSFTDFIRCTEYLIEQGYTSPDRIIAQGGSAGGLLVGAVVNMRPNLYKGIVAEVPFVDVLTSMLDPNLPLTTGEYEEWGNPKDSALYHYIKSYSPYDQVKPQEYPSMLITSGYHDSQVQYFEPAKWAAKLRATKTDNNLLLLKIDMNSGHGGLSGRYEYLKEQAFTYAYMLNTVGISE
ncbi:MAG: S9 family peptidase [Bacteroidales bacterium]|nr:S9 family peptidase [Bacteroidales bacterium]